MRFDLPDPHRDIIVRIVTGGTLMLFRCSRCQYVYVTECDVSLYRKGLKGGPKKCRDGATYGLEPLLY